MATEFDALGFEAPAPVGHPGRAGLPEGHPTGPEVGERLPDFELPEGLHIYGEPVPDGMVPTSVRVTGPEGLVVEPAIVPPTETLRLEVPIHEIDVPAIPIHMGHGQREADFDGVPHMRRLAKRKLRANPLGFLRFVATGLRLELAALLRRTRGR